MARPKKQDAPEADAATAAPSAPNAAAEAFAKVEPELAALGEADLAPIDLDISAAVTAVLAAAPKIREHRDAIAEELPKLPIKAVDQLDTYALAAWYSNLAHTYAAAGPEAAKALVDEAAKLREGLLIAAEALAHRGLLNADVVAKIRKGSGHTDMANDLTTLATLFKSEWGKVSSKTAVEKSEIERAEELGPAVMIAVAIRKTPGKHGDTEGQRARAYTLLMNAYDTCRRALAYLRWHEDDADSIAPSLHKKKPGRKPGSGKKSAEAEAAETAEPAEG
ncbi:MAG: hypothetical protein U0359_30845 [Byssovorax sp.]